MCKRPITSRVCWVLTSPTVTHKSQSSLTLHCAYLRRDGQAELAWVTVVSANSHCPTSNNLQLDVPNGVIFKPSRQTVYLLTFRLRLGLTCWRYVDADVREQDTQLSPTRRANTSYSSPSRRIHTCAQCLLRLTSNYLRIYEHRRSGGWSAANSSKHGRMVTWGFSRWGFSELELGLGSMWPRVWELVSVLWRSLG